MNESTINQLVADFQKPKPFGNPFLKAVIVWVLSWAIISICISLLGWRPGLWEEISNSPRLLIEVGFLLVASLFFHYIAVMGVIPGEKRPRGMVIAGSLLLMGGFAIFGYNFFYPISTPTEGDKGFHFICNLEVVIYALIGIGMHYIILRRFLFFKSYSDGFFLVLANALIPASLMQLACIYEFWHAVFFHYIPILTVLLGVFLVFFFASRKYFQKGIR